MNFKDAFINLRNDVEKDARDNPSTLVRAIMTEMLKRMDDDINKIIEERKKK